MKKRGLSEEDKELWRKVSNTAKPMHTAPVRANRDPSESPLPLPKQIEVASPKMSAFKIGSKAKDKKPTHNLMPSLSDQVASQPVQMDRKAFGRMKKGKLYPEARIDLHGMTLAQAHPALIGFVMRSYGEGKRLVLVITGKGKSKQDDGPIPVRMGVLKHQVPQWLQMMPLKSVVMQVSEAHLKHGGSGAYYVYLRRPR